MLVTLEREIPRLPWRIVVLHENYLYGVDPKGDQVLISSERGVVSDKTNSILAIPLLVHSCISCFVFTYKFYVLHLRMPQFIPVLGPVLS